MAALLASTLRIAIPGAGMGGLATALALAHQGFSNISVYESASNLGFVGAGIQVAPNLSRVLQKLGAWDHLKDNVVEMKAASIRASATDEELAHVSLTHISERYGHPHCVAHRSSLASALYDRCKAMGSAITFHFRTNVLDVDFDHTRLLVKERGEQGNGRWIDTDVILAADGVKSLIRKHMVARYGEEDNAKDTGQASYRIMLTRDQMAHDPELLALVDSNTTFRWIGPRRHIIAYPVSRNTIFNISSAQPDVNFAGEPDSTWTAKSDKGAMLKMYSDFCPLVMRLLQLVPEGDVCEWKLRVHAPLKTWIEGNVALVGDACHPTLPHLNQGAAQAIEDGAVLGVVLGKLTDKKDLHAALKVYERLRKKRAEHLVEQAAASGRTLQLTDPAAQAQRDEAFRQVMKGGANPDKAVDREVQDYVFGYDCIADAESRFDEFLAAEKST